MTQNDDHTHSFVRIPRLKNVEAIKRQMMHQRFTSASTHDSTSGGRGKSQISAAKM